MHYTEIFSGAKIENFFGMFFYLINIFAQNMHCGYMLEPPQRNRLREAVLASTHNVCFVSKIRKLGIHLQTPLFLYKSEV